MKRLLFLIFLNFKLTSSDFINFINQVKKSCEKLENNFLESDYKSIKKKLRDYLRLINRRERDYSALKKRQKKACLEVQEKLNEVCICSKILPTVSFIIPCYNRASVVKDVIESIYGQNIDIPFEVVAVDDASTDNTLEILKNYEKEKNNFFVYKHLKNKKAPAARNTAILHARGKFIFNADSDDVFEPNSLKKMINECILNDYDLCFFQYLNFFDDNNKSKIRPVLSWNLHGYIDLSKVLAKDYITISAGNRIFKKSCWLNVGGYLEEPGHDSWAFSFRLFARGYKGHIIPKSGYLHRYWTNRSNMFFNDRRNKVNDASPRIVVQDNSFLFNAVSFRKFQRARIPDGEFLFYFSGSRFQLVKSVVLNNLFSAYSCEDRKDYPNAFYFYNQVFKIDVRNKYLLLKTIYSALKIKKFDVSLQLLDKMLNIRM